jgi:hypothetical protein
MTQHEGKATEPPTEAFAAEGSIVSPSRLPSPMSRLKAYLYRRTIMGRGLMWAHRGTSRVLVKREEKVR